MAFLCITNYSPYPDLQLHLFSFLDAKIFCLASLYYFIFVIWDKLKKLYIHIYAK